MVKTLRITSVIVVLLSMAIFAFPVIYGVKTDQNIEEFLDSPDVLEVYQATSGDRPTTPVNQVHPLVQQAEVLRKILVPVVVKPQPRTQTAGRTKPPVATPQKVTPKFTVECTIYYEQNPQLSMAMIKEGTRRSWVMQSSSVNHLIIEEVRDGVVVVRNGEETFTLETPERKFVSPEVIIPSSSSGRITDPQPSDIASAPTGNSPLSRPTRVVSSSKTTSALRDESDEERSKRLEELYEKLKMISDKGSADQENDTGNLDDKVLQMKKLVTEFQRESMNISDEESERLDGLGEYLDLIQDTPEEK